MVKFVFPLVLIMLATASTLASESTGPHVSPYSGQQTRAIKSLSADDLSELRRGGGWGLARAAELNGVPGPVHLLELKTEIPLTESQVTRITALYETMKSRAIDLGEKLISLEQQLENHFRDRSIDDSTLRASLRDIAAVRGELRYVHLATHLQTPDILTQAQIDRYNSLRGYGDPDPCAKVPQGHDPEMWRRHNGCP